MFALIRHAEYSLGTGSLTPEGVEAARAIADCLKSRGEGWREVRTSPNPRTHETAAIIAQELGITVVDDARVGMDGNYVDLLPPTEPQNIIFVSHLPVLTQMLRTWSKTFKQDEPPLTKESCGYFVDPATQTINGFCAPCST